MEIREIIKRAHDTAHEKGWHDGGMNIGEKIALCHSELSEALEFARNERTPAAIKGVTHGPDGKPEGFGVEIADCIIRAMDLCAYYGVDLAECIALKMAYNETRPYRHGKVF